VRHGWWGVVSEEGEGFRWRYRSRSPSSPTRTGTKAAAHHALDPTNFYPSPSNTGTHDPKTGARLFILLIGLAATLIVLVTFAATTLVEEPSTLVAILVVLLVSIGVDVGWKRPRDAPLALP
jgi:hypothetical protein